jgi:hypothetical protein
MLHEERVGEIAHVPAEELTDFDHEDQPGGVRRFRSRSGAPKGALRYRCNLEGKASLEVCEMGVQLRFLSTKSNYTCVLSIPRVEGSGATGLPAKSTLNRPGTER